MRRVDTDKTEDYFNVLVYGRSGSGKTSLAATCAKPLVLLSERQGMKHLREACVRNRVEVPPVLYTESLQDYRDILVGLRGDKSKPLKIYSGKDCVYDGEWPETVVLDSLTAVGQLITKSVDNDSPPERGKDGLPARGMRAWGAIDDRFTSLMHAFRDAPVDILFLALASEKEVGKGDSKRREVKPFLPIGRFGEVVAASCNAVGFAYREEARTRDGVKIAWGVSFNRGSTHQTKSCGGLRSREPSHFGNWRQRVAGACEALPEQPVPEADSLEAEAIAEQEREVENADV